MSREQILSGQLLTNPMHPEGKKFLVNIIYYILTIVLEI
jgi:hypothetical protein